MVVHPRPANNHGNAFWAAASLYIVRLSRIVTSTPHLVTASAFHAPLVRTLGWGAERQLVAAADVKSGALLVSEYPIAFVETGPGEDDDGPWLLLESLLTSAPMFDRVVAEDLKMTKWPLSAQDEARIERLAQTYKRNAKKLAQLYHRVAANNIRYARSGVTGYGIWPTISRSNHSCDPTAKVFAAKQEALAELLVATRAIDAGAAICWNYYFDDAFIAHDWFTRNKRLHQDFQFLCRCPRCESERPAGVAELPRAELVAFFQRPRA